MIETDEQLCKEEHGFGSEEIPPPVEEYSPSTSPTPSSPRQEPVGMNNDEERFSVCENKYRIVSRFITIFHIWS